MVPYIQQFYTTECAACVVTSLLNYYNSYYNICDIRSVFRAGRDGTTLKQLVEILRYYNFNVNAYKIEVLDCNVKINFPSIITWEENHYVILEKLTSKYAYITDSKIGNLKIEYEIFLEKFSGIILLVQPNENFIRVKKKHNVVLNVLKPLITKYKIDLFLFCIWSILAYVITILISVRMQKIIDSLLMNKFMVKDIILILIVIVVGSVVGYLKGYKSAAIGVDFDREINESLVKKILNVPYCFFDRINDTNILFALDNVSSVKNLFLNGLFNIVFECGLIIVILAYIFLKNIRLFTIILLVILSCAIILFAFERTILFKNRKLVLELSKFRGFQVEFVSGILGIKTSSLEKEIYNKWNELYKEYYKSNKKYNIMYNVVKAILYIIVTLSPMLVVIVSYFFDERSSFTIGSSLSLYVLISLLFNSIYSFFSAIRLYKDNYTLVERMIDILRFQEPDNMNSKKRIDFSGNIRMDDVHFKYYKENYDILNSIILDINKEQKIAVVGASGSGKSTLLKVLSGLYDLNSGKIYYDNIDIKQLDLESVRKQIAYVSSDSCLMNRSIYENITMGLDAIPKSEVEHACKIVGIHNEIQKMPMKYNTVLSEMGKNMSSGQRQRILLARIILVKPKLILLDEAMSALDMYNEKKILNYFYNIRSTVIIITHRLNLLSYCDKIIVMKDGHIEESGTYEELIKNGKIFNKLLF